MNDWLSLVIPRAALDSVVPCLCHFRTRWEAMIKASLQRSKQLTTRSHLKIVTRLQLRTIKCRTYYLFIVTARVLSVGYRWELGGRKE